MSRFQFVDDHRGARRCRVLSVSRSGYRRVAGADVRAQWAQNDAALAERITVIRSEFDGTYGCPRVAASYARPAQRG